MDFISLVVHEEDIQNINGETYDLLKTATTHLKKENAHLYYWEVADNWGDNDEDFIIEDFVEEVKHEYLLISILECSNNGPVCILGKWKNNPFSCGVKITWDEKDKNNFSLPLKSLNTSPSAINCAKCSGQLKNPIPNNHNLKYCPICEP